MNRREFGLTTLASGLALALRPAVVLAGDTNYTHVDKMYPWDKVARTKEEIYDMPSTCNKVWNLEPVQWKNAFSEEEKIRMLFKDPKKMDSVLVQLIDNNVTNDEASWVNVTSKGVEYRILTPDTSFAPIQSKAKKDVDRYGDINFYMTYVKIDNFDPEEIVGIVRKH